MNITTINNSFTIFGNFADVIKKLPRLISIFNGFQIKTFKERLPNGEEIDSYKFMFENKCITLRPGRLDLEFAFSQATLGKDFLQFVKDTSAKLLTVDRFDGVRIAFNSVEFLMNENGKLTEKLNKIFNFGEIFGESPKETSIRLNHQKYIGNEEFNSIVTIQDGTVMQNSSKERKPAVFINKDINTVATNITKRFSLYDYSNYLLSMMLEAEQRTNAILCKLD